MVSILMNTPAVNARWCRYPLSRYIRPGKKVLFIPFSFHEDFIPDEDAWHSQYDPGCPGYEELVVPMERMGISREDVYFVNYFTDTPRTLGFLIRQADIIDLPGGYPDRLISRLWEFGAISQLASFPKVILGFSAGAMVQLELFHATPEEEGQEFFYGEGFDRLQGFDLEVHYTGSELQRDCIRRTMEETGLPVYAVEDRGGIIVDHGRMRMMGNVHIFHPNDL